MMPKTLAGYVNDLESKASVIHMEERDAKTSQRFMHGVQHARTVMTGMSYDRLQ
jgi:hypothetical protein